jgi:glucose/arabinose dehydrogenase
MKNLSTLPALAFVLLMLNVCNVYSQSLKQGDTVTLPAPHATKSKMNFSKVQGWKDGRTPIAPKGFVVTAYANDFDNPRWMYVTPNGDVIVAESNTRHPWYEKLGAFVIGASRSNSMRNSANRLTLLRDTNNDGLPDERTVFLDHLNYPFGMLILSNWFYVANTDAVWRYPYKAGDKKITSKGEKVIDLPAGKHNQHWTRNMIANKDGTKIYIAVGSGSNVGEHGMEHEFLKASILEMNPDGSGLRVYASGLRNPVGMDWAPGTSTLWTAVNERDQLGDDLVPDYATHVEDGAFYGWPYTYFGNHRDARMKESMPAYATHALVPDVPLGSHTASLGLAFYRHTKFPAQYHEGAFIAQHGSWNRSTLSGYKVVFIPFKNGKPSGEPVDFLTGFVADLKKDKVYGRPVGVTMLPDGSMLVTDDTSNVIWRVAIE